jgi:hypothetical protein
VLFGRPPARRRATATINIEMPAVEGCSANDCAFNLDGDCHAKAVTVGDGIHPGCDTCFDSSRGRTADGSGIAGVGACKVAGCQHNPDLECMAQNIQVSAEGDAACCMTYAPR